MSEFVIVNIPVTYEEKPEVKILYGKAIDMTGERYGRLVCLRPAEVRDKSGGLRWMCRCDCGNTTLVQRGNLVGGTVTSCGCYRIEVNYQNGKGIKHGHASNPSGAYKTWEAMRGRCNNPNSDWYHRYGGRGIEVCERWDSFANFLADMGERPEGMTIDRIDSDGNYGPDNCKWATHKEQSNNKSKINSKITKEDAVKIRLDTRTLTLIAQEWGVGISTIHRIRHNKTHLP